MSGEQRAMLAQLQQNSQGGQYPSMGNPILGLQIPSIQKFSEQYPQMATSPYVLPFHRQHQAPYDWAKMFQTAMANANANPPPMSPPVLVNQQPAGKGQQRN